MRLLLQLSPSLTSKDCSLLLTLRRLINLCWILALLVALATPALAEEQLDAMEALGISADEQTPTNAVRSPRPVSKIAENVTVISREQIKLLNAHSLADVLQTVPGIFVFNTRTPGNFTFFNIQGEDDSRGNILLLIDGISQGNLLQGANDPGLIPVQHIERIEIIKGSASAAWGPALGGVVNVITNSPERDRLVGGNASASYGERGTSDLVADVSGSSHGFGYYLSGGNLHSAGLTANNGTNRNNLYGKLSYDLPTKGNLTIGGSFNETKRGLTEIFAFDFDPTFIEHDNSKDQRHYGFINFSYPLRPDLTLELLGLNTNLKQQSIFATLETAGVVPYAHYVLKESNSGAKAKLIWGDSHRNLTAGIDYLHSKITQDNQFEPTSPYAVDRRRDSISYYANAVLSFDRLTILPGIRYDKTGLDDNTTNYTLGATYRLTDKTLLRSYAARGFAMPNASVQSVPERIWTLQAGIESEAIPFLWLKGTYFYNHIWNIQDFQDDVPIFRKRDRQGFEVEAKTTPVGGVSLSAGYTFIDTRDSDTNERIKDLPVQILKTAISYSNPESGTKGILTGNYVVLDMQDWRYAHYSPMLWNLHVSQQLQPGKEFSPELFFSINNLFNGAQNFDYWYPTAPRWIEGGVRFSF